jgi:very-short-patch-repair endonuclease
VEPWAIDENEELITAPIAFPRSKRDDDYRGNLYVSARGGFGRYLKLKLCPRIPNLKEKDIKEIIAQLFQVLAIGLLQVVEDPAKPEDVPGYQLPASTFIWLAGDGTKAFYDPIRTPSRSKVGEKPNPFFVRFYQTLAAELCDFEAREHTAQVPYEVRIEREDRFRSADLPILFCSPTMELGVDIAQLNAVNMRNVPPTPANYAQRSGRAGRSGQPALVYTYCTTGSPHDQYFFRRPEFMVSGAVSPPRIDLSNEDLIRAHVYAVWLSETGLDLKRSLKDVLDVDGENPTLELRPSIRTAVQSQAARKSALDRLNRILATLGDEVTGADWYYDGWLKKTLDAVDLELEDACERWRGIFKSARDQIESQTKIVNDLSRIQKDRDEAKRLRAEAEAQIELLTESSGYEFSDFYSYRYFAGEGFLPGYNFPRLPLSAFIPGRRRIKKKMDEFISRPRFLAISEFGPRSIIYHEGVRYIINKVILSTGEDVLTTSARLCPECGYLHSHKTDAPGADLCEHCKAPLTETLTPLLKLYNVSTKRRDRINSDEEERQRMGYELKTGVRFSPHSNHLPSRTATVCREDGTPLLTLDYGHSATLWRINLGWRRRQDKNLHGFVLDRERGYWAKNEQDESDLEDPMSPRRLRVIPYVEDTKNALILKPEIELPPGALASLQYAVKNAIQVIHQLEDDELAAEPLPSAEKRQRFLFYEAAEGGAGVLRHLVEDSNAFRLIAQEALRLCHFNPSNGDDERPSCEAACYDCLLSYYNQPEHDILDRREVRDLLLELSRATVKVSPRAVPRSVHLENLRALCDSDLEKSWLEFIESNNLNLPDEVQKLIAECETKPDFFYSRHKTAVFIDGPVHDAADIAAQDRKIEDSLLEYGFLTIRFRYDEKEQWLETCSRFSNVFGKVPQTSNT